MFGIVLQNLSPAERLQDLLQSNSLFNHLRVGMQCNAVAPSRYLLMNESEYSVKLGWVNVLHRAARLSRAVSECKATYIGILTL